MKCKLRVAINQNEVEDAQDKMGLEVPLRYEYYDGEIPVQLAFAYYYVEADICVMLSGVGVMRCAYDRALEREVKRIVRELGEDYKYTPLRVSELEVGKTYYLMGTDDVCVVTKIEDGIATANLWNSSLELLEIECTDYTLEQ